MSDALLQALSTLYHHPNQAEKKRASEWLEQWRLKSEAWNTADSILHSASRNVEVLFFCSQTLAFKVQQDFEELPEGQVPQLRDSLAELMRKFSGEEGMEIVHKQLALAMAAFAAHVSPSFWAPLTCVQWLGERFGTVNDAASVSSLMELLLVLPEEAKSHRIGLHPEHRNRFLRELENDFPHVLTLLEKCRLIGAVEEQLKVLSNWLQLCPAKSLQKSMGALGPFVQVAVDCLESQKAFAAAVNCLSELIYVTGNSTAMPEMQQLCDFMASTIVQYQPTLQRHELDEEQMAGMGRLFCDLGYYHDHLMLASTETAAALIEGVLSVTAHPETAVHQHAFDFWERMTYRVSRLISIDALSVNRHNYFVSVFERLMTVLLELAQLPEEYLEMAAEERKDIDRRDIRTAMQDAVEVIGEQRCIQSIMTALHGACQSGGQNWRQIEALLFALESIAVVSSRVKGEMAVPLFQVLGAVPDQVVIQSAMCGCLASYASWLPTWAEQTGSDPLPTLLPVIFKNLAAPEWASAAAVDALITLCKWSRSQLPVHAGELLELHQRIIFAANAFHQWMPVAADGFVMKESEAIDITGALYQGITRSEEKAVASRFLTTVSEGLLKDLAAATEAVQTASAPSEEKLVILVSRLKTVFRNCAMEEVTGQLLGGVCTDLLQLASNASSSAALVEAICTCLRYAVKNAGSCCESTLPTLTAALPRLFMLHYHCGYLYVASEIAKKFGKSPVQAPRVQLLVVELLTIVCSALKTPADFKEAPHLADDVFLMAGRVLNYCPDALLVHLTLLPQIIDTASKGMLVQHDNARQSVLRFLSDLASLKHHKERIQQTLLPRGPYLTQLLMAGVVGGLPSRALDDLSETLRSFVRFSDQSLEWISLSFGMLPDVVLSLDEKSTFLKSFGSPEVQEAERLFLRAIDDLADVCRRSRIVRQAAQSALTPESHT